MVTNRARKAGFVMLDAMAALVLLGAGVFACVVFFRSQVRELRNTQERYEALLIAQSEMERLHAVRYDRIAVGESRPVSLDLPSARRLKEAAGTLTVKEPERGLKRAEVSIGWTSPTGRALHVTLEEEFAAEGGAQ